MNNKAQAMIIDALFFLMLCGMSAAILAWASSVYGNQALDAYKYLYLMDLETGALETITQSNYMYNGNQLYWIDQLGRYLDGQFNENDDRFKLLLKEWNDTCNVVGAPLVLYVYPESGSLGKTSVCDSSGNCASLQHPLIFTCPFTKQNTKQKSATKTSTLESVLDYMCGSGGTTGYVDLGARAGTNYAHLLFLNTNSGTLSGCSNQNTEPPYYASENFTKLCHDRICDMYTKIYY